MGKRTHIVIGGTSGLGLAVARELVRRDHQVIVLGNMEDEVERIGQESGLIGLVCDVSNGALLEQTIKHIFTTYGEIHGVAHCAAMWAGGPLAEFSRDQIRRAIDVNVLGVTYVLQALLEQLSEQGSGNVVVIGAAAVHQAHPGIPLYGATKAFVD
jgi:NADP-dependent 3-hydroxy acid dehydrogenase YdfG